MAAAGDCVVSSCQPFTRMHQKKRGARQPQRSSLPSIPDHHGWQLWGTGSCGIWIESSALRKTEGELLDDPFSRSIPLWWAAHDTGQNRPWGWILV